MESQYKEELANIYAPKELIQRTEQLMKVQKKAPKKKKGSFAVLVACAAVVCLSVYGYQDFRSNNHIEIKEIGQSSAGMTLDKNLGVHQNKGDTVVKDGYRIEASYNKSIVPNELWEIETSKIKGHTVRIGMQKDEAVYCVVFKLAGKYYYIEKEGGNQKELIHFLKKNYF